MATCKESSRRSANESVRLSKSLSWLLRHGAQKEGLTMDASGYVDVDVILRHRNFRGVTMEDLRNLVENNDKKRFALTLNDRTKKWQIKANQGHTLKVNDLDLKPLSAEEIQAQYPNIIHGTNIQSWEIIKSSGGLSRMSRNHIHLCPGEPGDEKVVSGMRASSNVWIYVDAASAIKDGFQFFLSPNNVILTSGNGEGFLPIQFFHKVLLKRKGTRDETLLP